MSAARRLGALAVIVLLAASLAACVPPGAKVRIAVFGDSLTAESERYIRAGLDADKVELDFFFFAGTAMCQWLDAMREESKTRPTAVIIEFAGNSFDYNPCMLDPSTGHAYPYGSAGWLDRYTADAHTAASIWATAGVPTFWAQIPPIGVGPFAAMPDVDTLPLNRVYAEVADRLVPAGAAVAADDGSFTWWMECRRGEPCGIGGSQGAPPPGMNQVRNQDRIHFCPTAPSCSSPYVPGAARFGGALAAAVAGVFGIGAPDGQVPFKTLPGNGVVRVAAADQAMLLATGARPAGPRQEHRPPAKSSRLKPPGWLTACPRLRRNR